MIGVDIGIHKALALCTDLVGTIRGSHRIEVSAEHSNAERVQAARTALKRAARAASVRLADVLAVGVGTTGPVDPNTGTIALSPALPEWSGVDIRKELTGLGSGPVIVGNDANLGTLAEHWRGIARDAPDVVYILAGHQFSVGILIDRRVRQGRHGAAGEIGVLKAARWYEARDALAAGKPVDDPAFIDDLATGIAASTLLFDPDKIIIGGGLSRAGDTLLKPLKRRLDELCPFPISRFFDLRTLFVRAVRRQCSVVRRAAARAGSGRPLLVVFLGVVPGQLVVDRCHHPRGRVPPDGVVPIEPLGHCVAGPLTGSEAGPR